MSIRKGQTFRRKSDGLLFVVKSTSRTQQGAFLQCIDAARIFGWYYQDQIAARFERI
jgi:hypothetical protein